MPKLLSDFEDATTYSSAPGSVGSVPSIAAHAMEVIAACSAADSSRGNILVQLLSSDAKLTVAAYTFLGSQDLQRKALEAACDAALPETEAWARIA